jgi:thioredoxin reductase
VRKSHPPAPKRGTDDPSSVVIVGGGAASLAAAANLAVSLAHQSMRIDEKTNQNLIAAFVRELGTREGRFSDGLGNKVANLPRFSEGDR